MRGSLTTDTPVVLLERALDEIDPAAWDRFARACDASFLGSWRVVRAEGLRSPLRIVELFAAGPSPHLKIGQCAIAAAHDRARFLDRLHLLPAHADLWAASLRQIVERCAAQAYLYGSPWNHERRCLDCLRRALPHGRVVDVSAGIDAVEFPAWDGFAAYRRCVSENIRRDYKKALTAAPVLAVRRGVAACRDVGGLVALRRQVMRRNQERFSSLMDAPLHALKLACVGDKGFIATVRANGRPEAAFFGVEFGDRVYYISGGTRDRSEGFGSYLFLTLIERWFAEHPRGALYLGVTEPGFAPETYAGGNLLYRRKLRARSVPGTAFTIDIAP
jgi:hypothetical protein